MVQVEGIFDKVAGRAGSAKDFTASVTLGPLPRLQFLIDEIAQRIGASASPATPTARNAAGVTPKTNATKPTERDKITAELRRELSTTNDPKERFRICARIKAHLEKI